MRTKGKIFVFLIYTCSHMKSSNINLNKGEKRGGSFIYIRCPLGKIGSIVRTHARPADQKWF